MVRVDGVRTSFLMSGTDFKNLMPHDLLRYALTGMVNKTGTDKSIVDYILIQEVKTSSIAHEVALGAGFSDRIPTNSLNVDCIFANQGFTICLAMMSMATPHYGKMRQLMLSANKAKTATAKLGLVAKIRPDYLAPEPPAIAEISANETMGHSTYRRSNTMAKEAQEKEQGYQLR